MMKRFALEQQADRIRRMHGREEPEVKKSGKHISADDLADGFLLNKDDRHFLSYKDGKANIEDGEYEQKENINRKERDSKEEGEEEEGESEEESDAETVDSHSNGEMGEGRAEETSANEEHKKKSKGNQNKLQVNKHNTVREAATLELPYLFAALSGRVPVRLYHGVLPQNGPKPTHLDLLFDGPTLGNPTAALNWF
ncbi:uncharacterized protein LOC144589464 [Pogona vitticeps]